MGEESGGGQTSASLETPPQSERERVREIPLWRFFLGAPKCYANYIAVITGL